MTDGMTQAALFPRQEFTDPEAFEEFIAGAAPHLSVRPVLGGRFCVDISLALSPWLALFRADATNFSTGRPAAGAMWSLTIPIRSEFRASVGPRSSLRAFDQNEIYFFADDHDFKFQALRSSSFLVANILSFDLQRKARALVGRSDQQIPEVISRNSPFGGSLVRFAHHFWRELQRPDGVRASPIATAEMTDCLLSLLAVAASAPDSAVVTTARTNTVRRAEDFLLRHLSTPVTRSEITEAVGVSMSTLSRGFQAQHSLGPMAWLRARRIEASYAALQEAAPGETTVTEVARRYGFAHLGRFAAEYFRAFGEQPSRTLQS